MDIVELIVKRRHLPYPGVLLQANTRVAIGPPDLAEALCARGFFEKVAPDVVQKEEEAEEMKGKKKGK